MKTQIAKNLISFPLVLRGNWRVKVSIYKDKQIMVFAQHTLDEVIAIRVFGSEEEAVNFIKYIVEKDEV